MKIQHTLLAALGCLCLLTTGSRAQVPNLVSYQGRVAVNGVNFDSTTAGRSGEFKFALVTTRNSVQATATAVVSGGSVTSIIVTNGGTGYPGFPDFPAVTISGGGGSGATAGAGVSSGVVFGVSVLNGGSGYTSPPTVVIAPPPPTHLVTLWSHSNFSYAGSEPLLAPVPLQVTKGLYSVLLGDTSVPGMTQPIPTSVWSNPDVRLRVWFSDGTPNGFQLLTPDQRLAPYGYLPDGIVTSATLADGAVSAAKLADGAVTATKLGTGAVQSGNIAAGAVTAAELANGAITAAKVGSDVGLWSVNGAAIYRGSGNVGIGTSGPNARLHVGPSLGAVHPAVASPFAIINGGSLGGTLNDDLTLSQFVFAPGGGHQASFGIHARKTGAGTGWSATSLGLTFDVDATPSAGGAIWFQGGNVGIGTLSPGAGLDVANGALRVREKQTTHSQGAWVEWNKTGAGNTWLLNQKGLGTGGFVFGEVDSANNVAQRLIIDGNGGVFINNHTVVTGEITCVALNITSDRNAKENFKPVNAREVLDKVARMPISEWQYKQQSDARHIGPMAQDFREAFALGHDEKHITSVDADGVALAAIQGLNEKLEEQAREKDVRIRELEESVEELKTLMSQLAGQRKGGNK